MASSREMPSRSRMRCTRSSASARTDTITLQSRSAPLSNSWGASSTAAVTPSSRSVRSRRRTSRSTCRCETELSPLQRLWVVKHQPAQRRTVERAVAPQNLPAELRGQIVQTFGGRNQQRMVNLVGVQHREPEGGKQPADRAFAGPLGPVSPMTSIYPTSVAAPFRAAER